MCLSFCPSVCPSIHPSLLPSGCFLWILSLVLSKFWHGARNVYEVVLDRAGFSRKSFFATKIRKMDQKWAKNRVFLIYWKIWFCWICSVMKTYIICCVPEQIPYFGKFLFLRYRPKCSQSIRLSDFLNVDTKSNKLKVNQKILRGELPKMGVASLIIGL